MRFLEAGRTLHTRNRRVRGADVRVGVTATIAEGAAGHNGVGLLCRIQDDNKGYYTFILYADGHYLIDRAVNDYGLPLVSSEADPRLPRLALDGGPVALRADCAGDTLTFSVNGRVDDYWARAIP